MLRIFCYIFLLCCSAFLLAFFPCCLQFIIFLVSLLLQSHVIDISTFFWVYMAGIYKIGSAYFKSCDSTKKPWLYYLSPLYFLTNQVMSYQLFFDFIWQVYTKLARPTLSPVTLPKNHKTITRLLTATQHLLVNCRNLYMIFLSKVILPITYHFTY